MGGGIFMTQNKKILDFAMKYYYLYLNPQTTEAEVTDGFAEACRELGFSPEGDPYELLPDIRRTGYIFLSEEDTERILENLVDSCTLGSRIFSRWQTTVQRKKDGWNVRLTSHKSRKWFTTAFFWLAMMVSGKGRNPFIFRGQLRSFRLRSCLKREGRSFCATDDLEQVLSVNPDGTIWLERYHMGDWGLELTEKQKIPADAETVKELLSRISDFFSGYAFNFTKNADMWDLTLQNQEGQEVHGYGLLRPDALFFSDLSSFIRKALGRKDLWLFDGNPDYIERMEIVYHRHEICEDPIEEEDYPCDYHEQLIIDRESATVERFRQRNDSCDLRNIWHMKYSVPKFLDSLKLNIFSQVKGNPNDVLPDPDRTDTYTIRITTCHKGMREIRGTFDKKGLPVDWPQFAEKLKSFLAQFESGDDDMLDKDNYSRTLRSKDDLIFCYVVFNRGGKSYCYLADEEYKPGEKVKVPAGEADEYYIVTVKRIVYRPAEESPYPLDRIKRVIGRIPEEEERQL